MKKLIAAYTILLHSKAKIPLPKVAFSISNPNEISLEQIKFIFHQAEKRLEESIKNYDSTTNKSITFITLAVAILSTLTSYFFVQNDTDGSFDSKLCTVLLLSIYIFFVLIYLVQNILPTNYLPIGTNPSILLTEKIYRNSSFTDENREEMILKNIYYSELSNYEARIECNFKTNSDRLNRLRCTIWCLILFPVVGIITYLLTSFFSGIAIIALFFILV